MNSGDYKFYNVIQNIKLYTFKRDITLAQEKTSLITFVIKKQTKKIYYKEFHCVFAVQAVLEHL